MGKYELGNFPQFCLRNNKKNVIEGGATKKHNVSFSQSEQIFKRIGEASATWLDNASFIIRQTQRIRTMKGDVSQAATTWMPSPVPLRNVRDQCGGDISNWFMSRLTYFQLSRPEIDDEHSFMPIYKYKWDTPSLFSPGSGQMVF